MLDRNALYEAALLGIDALVRHVETLISNALLMDAMAKIQKDTGVDFGPTWKHSPKHEDDNEQARKVV